MANVIPLTTAHSLHAQKQPLTATTHGGASKTETTPENATSLADTLSPYTVHRNDAIAALNML